MYKLTIFCQTKKTKSLDSLHNKVLYCYSSSSNQLAFGKACCEKVHTLLYSSHDNISDCSIKEYRSIVATITGHQA